MKIIDSRSGKQVMLEDIVTYPEGDWWKLKSVDEGWFSGSILIETPRGRVRVPLTVRFFHPDFLFQKVGFVPS